MKQRDTKLGAKGRNPIAACLAKKYLGSYHRKCVEAAGLRESDSVLDFGCGDKKLREFLPKNIKYAGYEQKAEALFF